MEYFVTLEAKTLNDPKNPHVRQINVVWDYMEEVNWDAWKEDFNAREGENYKIRGVAVVDQ